MKKMVVSIIEYGAESDSKNLQTDKIQAAIDDCFQAGGGEVRIPEGRWLTGGLMLRSNITLHLLENAVLVGSKNPEDYFGYLHDTVDPLPDEMITDGLWNPAVIGAERDYRFMRIPGSRWNNALIKAVNAKNVQIIGEKGSVLDGSDCYDELGEEHYRGPHCINMYYCENITLKGYTVKDSANWAHAIFYSDNISAQNLSVLAGHDGIHVTVCNNVKITDCNFYCGDDCIAGFANVNVLVENCELNSACSAFRFGGTNVLIEKCHMYGPCKYLFRGSLTTEEKKNGIKPSVEGHRNNMLSAFTYYSDFTFEIKQQPGNIVIRDCRIDYADRFLHYNYSGNERWQQNRPLASMSFENIRATDISMPLTAYGDKEVLLKLTMKNVEISLREGYEDIVLMNACNYEKIKLENMNLTNYAGETLIKTWSDGDIELKEVHSNHLNDQLVKKAEERFNCGAI